MQPSRNRILTLSLLALAVCSCLTQKASDPEADPSEPEKGSSLAFIKFEAPVQASIRDTVLITASFRDADFRPISSDSLDAVYSWTVDRGPSLQTPVPRLSLTVPDTANEEYTITLTVRKNGKLLKTDSLKVRILMDPPIASLTGKDSCHVDSLIRVSAGGSRPGGFGSITKYEWRFGTGEFFQSAGPDTALAAPAQPQEGYSIVLRVTDDDGLTDQDTLSVRLYKSWHIVTRLSKFGNRIGQITRTSEAFVGKRLYVACEGVGLGYFEDTGWVDIPVPSPINQPFSYGPSLSANAQSELFLFVPATGGGYPYYIQKYAQGVWTDLLPENGGNGSRFVIRAGEEGGLFYSAHTKLYSYDGAAWSEIFNVQPLSGYILFDWGVHKNQPVVMYKDSLDYRMRIKMLREGQWVQLGQSLDNSNFNMLKSGGGKLYLATEFGLQEFDGQEWRFTHTRGAMRFAAIEVVGDTVYGAVRSAGRGIAVHRYAAGSWSVITPWLPDGDTEAYYHTVLNVDGQGVVRMLHDRGYWIYR